jgi:hypothetical protein
MGFPSVAKAVLGLTGAALVFFGIAFLGAALALALEPRLGVAGSAAVTGLILLLPPCIWGVAAGFRRPEYLPPGPDHTVESAAVRLLHSLVRDKPLLAILGAAFFGAAEVLLRRKK